MTFVATKQLDGSRYAGWNCNVAVTRSLILFGGGKNVPSTADLRIETGDFKGGTRLDQMAALAAHYGVEMTIHYDTSFGQVWAWLQDPDIAMDISIWYGPVHGTSHDGDPNFTGNHAIGGNNKKIFDPLADDRRPSIPKAPEVWSQSLLRAACGDLNVDGREGHYTALGLGKAWCGVVHAPKNVTPPPPPLSDVVFRYGGSARSRGDYKVRPGITALVRTAPNNTNNSIGHTPVGIIVTRLLGGQKLPFHVDQTTVSGALVAGSRVWHGDATGKRWIHHSLVQAA